MLGSFTSKVKSLGASLVELALSLFPAPSLQDEDVRTADKNGTKSGDIVLAGDEGGDLQVYMMYGVGSGVIVLFIIIAYCYYRCKNKGAATEPSAIEATTYSKLSQFDSGTTSLGGRSTLGSDIGNDIEGGGGGQDRYKKTPTRGGGKNVSNGKKDEDKDWGDENEDWDTMKTPTSLYNTPVKAPSFSSSNASNSSSSNNNINNNNNNNKRESTSPVSSPALFKSSAPVSSSSNGVANKASSPRSLPRPNSNDVDFFASIGITAAPSFKVAASKPANTGRMGSIQLQSSHSSRINQQVSVKDISSMANSDNSASKWGDDDDLDLIE